jgi:hypothetical protein
MFSFVYRLGLKQPGSFGVSSSLEHYGEPYTRLLTPRNAGGLLNIQPHDSKRISVILLSTPLEKINLAFHKLLSTGCALRKIMGHFTCTTQVSIHPHLEISSYRIDRPHICSEHYLKLPPEHLADGWTSQTTRGSNSSQFRILPLARFLASMRDARVEITLT